ncbi:MAG: PEP-CTERM sorting domain-containing protein [Planctomycetota bacterium]
MEAYTSSPAGGPSPPPPPVARAVPAAFGGNELTADQGNAGMWLDNISVVLIPEPSTLLLLGLGVVMARKKR